jgi:hypothetical protein
VAGLGVAGLGVAGLGVAGVVVAGFGVAGVVAAGLGVAGLARCLISFSTRSHNSFLLALLLNVLV